MQELISRGANLLMPDRTAIAQNLRGNFQDRISLLLALLVTGDLAFILLYILNRIYRFTNMEMVRLDIEASYPEFYQYMKFVWILALLIYLVVMTRNKGYISWTLVFLYFLADDSLQIHERMGDLFLERIAFKPPFNISMEDVGELAAFAIFGLPLLALLVWSYYHGSGSFKKISKDLLLLVVVYAFIVVVFDFVHAALELSRSIDRVWALVEEGGEMVVVSTMVWYLFRVAFHKGEPRLFLLERAAEGTSDTTTSSGTTIPRAPLQKGEH